MIIYSVNALEKSRRPPGRSRNIIKNTLYTYSTRYNIVDGGECQCCKAFDILVSIHTHIVSGLGGYTSMALHIIWFECIIYYYQTRRARFRFETRPIPNVARLSLSLYVSDLAFNFRLCFIFYQHTKCILYILKHSFYYIHFGWNICWNKWHPVPHGPCGHTKSLMNTTCNFQCNTQIHRQRNIDTDIHGYIYAEGLRYTIDCCCVLAPPVQLSTATVRQYIYIIYIIEIHYKKKQKWYDLEQYRVFGW